MRAKQPTVGDFARISFSVFAQCHRYVSISFSSLAWGKNFQEIEIAWCCFAMSLSLMRKLNDFGRQTHVDWTPKWMLLKYTWWRGSNERVSGSFLRPLAFGFCSLAFSPINPLRINDMHYELLVFATYKGVIFRRSLIILWAHQLVITVGFNEWSITRFERWIVTAQSFWALNER